MKFAIKSDINTSTTIISTSTAALEQEESEEQRPYTIQIFYWIRTNTKIL